MACATFASARTNNHSKTTRSSTSWRNYATTTTPFARVSTLVYRVISQHVSSPMAASRILKFPNGSHTHHEGFSGKPLHWPTDKNHSPLITHHRTRHRNLQQSAPKKQTTAVDLPARKPSPGSIPPGRTCWVSCATVTSSE